jgi:hypothetical protein
MANTVRVTYTRKLTNKLSDGSFESFELGGDAELELGDVDSVDKVNEAYDRLYADFVSNIETKVLQIGESLTPAPVEAPKMPAGSWGKPQEEDAQDGDDSRSSWVDRSIKQETERIQEGMTKHTLPGERFARPPATVPDEPVDLGIKEGEAATFMNVKTFLDNKGTKVDKMAKGGKYAMIRVGERGVVPGDYITVKSFDQAIVPDMEAIIDNRVQKIDVYGHYKSRSNDPDTFDLIVEGIRPAEG